MSTLAVWASGHNVPPQLHTIPLDTWLPLWQLLGHSVPGAERPLGVQHAFATGTVDPHKSLVTIYASYCASERLCHSVHYWLG